ncbi:MAG: hypothetical protein WD431_20165 [Cyclobacteriaceae bacterium]
MENHIRLALKSLSKALEMIRLEEMDRYRKHIENADREKISLVSSIMMAKIFTRLETNLKVATQKGKSENLTRSMEKIFSSETHSRIS